MVPSNTTSCTYVPLNLTITLMYPLVYALMYSSPHISLVMSFVKPHIRYAAHTSCRTYVKTARRHDSNKSTRIPRHVSPGMYHLIYRHNPAMYYFVCKLRSTKISETLANLGTSGGRFRVRVGLSAVRGMIQGWVRVTPCVGLCCVRLE